MILEAGSRWPVASQSRLCLNSYTLRASHSSVTRQCQSQLLASDKGSNLHVRDSPLGSD